MAFSSVTEFFAMGGYGFYVWLSYGVTAAALLALVWHGRMVRKQLHQAAQQQAQRQQRLARRQQQQQENR
ncbi:heme exporter protein CcmD [Pseudidiomarina mangrovi]|uniref:heme exporter protein CcmD n=1 Tax=Pseudidiomarina mangrovi TaxID=2487133 RepID=UPI000FCCA1FD|nr:heme exporter protein CcmD [Pseudidiomarina mangrovi]